LLQRYARGGTKAIPPIFLRKYNYNNNKIYVDDPYIFATMRLFSHKFSVTFNALANAE
jgi:hypothetical protein